MFHRIISSRPVATGFDHLIQSDELTSFREKQHQYHWCSRVWEHLPLMAQMILFQV